MRLASERPAASLLSLALLLLVAPRLITYGIAGTERLLIGTLLEAEQVLMAGVMVAGKAATLVLILGSLVAVLLLSRKS